MEAHYPPILVDATPDEILAVLKDIHRQQCGCDPGANPNITLSRDSTIDDWRDASDLLPWKELALAMNMVWSVNISLKQWESVLRPPGKHTLGEVCDLLSKHAKMPRVRPAMILGRECLSAGMFLTVRSYLAADGADVSDLSPSTPLEPYWSAHRAAILWKIVKLAPGKMPVAKVESHPGRTFVFGTLVLGIVVGQCAGILALTIIATTLMILAVITIIVVTAVAPPKAEFVGVRTFRDLSKLLATGAHSPID